MSSPVLQTSQMVLGNIRTSITATFGWSDGINIDNSHKIGRLQNSGHGRRAGIVFLVFLSFTLSYLYCYGLWSSKQVCMKPLGDLWIWTLAHADISLQTWGSLDIWSPTSCPVPALHLENHLFFNNCLSGSELNLKTNIASFICPTFSINI